MAAQKGLEMLLKVDSDGAGTYQTIGGIQSNNFDFDEETVDITSQDDVDRYRQLFAGAGVKSISVGGSGVFKDGADAATIMTYKQNGTIRNWQIFLPSFFRVQVAMAIPKFSFTSDQNKEVKFTISLESAGSPTFTAI